MKRLGSVQTMAGMALAAHSGEPLGFLAPNGVSKSTETSVLARLARRDVVIRC